jgi:hypothetical protein
MVWPKTFNNSVIAGTIHKYAITMLLSDDFPLCYRQVKTKEISVLKCKIKYLLQMLAWTA